MGTALIAPIAESPRDLIVGVVANGEARVQSVHPGREEGTGRDLRSHSDHLEIWPFFEKFTKRLKCGLAVHIEGGKNKEKEWFASIVADINICRGRCDQREINGPISGPEP